MGWCVCCVIVVRYGLGSLYVNVLIMILVMFSVLLIFVC